MDDKFKPSRRAFLRGGAAVAAGSVAGAAVAQNGPDPLITELQDWASYTGVGVDEVMVALSKHRISLLLDHQAGQLVQPGQAATSADSKSEYVSC